MAEYGYNPDALQETDAPIRRYGEDDGEAGDLLSLPIDTPEQQKVVAHKVDRIWKSTNTSQMKKRIAQWRVNEYQREGIAGAQLVKKQDESSWIAWIPKKPVQLKVINKAATLCRKLVNIVLADPPAPDPIPGSGQDEDEDAAEFSARALQDIQSETGTNEAFATRTALSKACTHASGFIRYYIDPKGGGKGPIIIQAGPEAQSVEDALGPMQPVMQPAMDEMGQPIVDPMTGQPAQQPVVDPETGQPQMQQVGEWPTYISRFVRPDGSLTDEENEAATHWLPSIKREVLTGLNVRLLPHTAEDLWDAEGVIIAAFPTWGEVKQMNPELAQIPDDEKAKILSYKMEDADKLLPKGYELGVRNKDNEDETRVCTYTLYFGQCEKYPQGLYIVVLADCYVIDRQPWVAEIEGKEEPLPIPLTQYKLLTEGRDDPYGVAPMEILGPGNEVRGHILGSLLDHMDKLNNRLRFVPTNSIVSPKQLQNPTATVIPINPGGEPKYEDIPEFSRDGYQTFVSVGEEMDNSMGLDQTAQGLESADVRSGKHAMAILAQAHAQLSESKDHIVRGYVRACRIQLQLVRAFYDRPRRMQWKGDDGAYKEKAWTGSDLRTTRDVEVKTGTMTMLAPASKVAYAQELAQLGLLTPLDLKDILRSNAGGTIGLQEDPYLLRIRRQISQWREGPPDGWQPLPPVQQMTPMGPQLVPQPDPVLSEMWAPVPSDTMPDVAGVRLEELKRLTASTRFMKHPPEWRAAIEQEFMRMAQVVQMAAMQAQAQPQPQQKRPGGGDVDLSAQKKSPNEPTMPQAA